MKHIALFASGRGSNAEAIIAYTHTQPDMRVALIVCNKPQAPVIAMAHRKGIPTLVLTRAQFENEDLLLNLLRAAQIDFIGLAGFLWRIPLFLVDAYMHRMVNIHPALLPKYGGKGMYGMHVHQAVKAAREKETGISIHWVTENYDEGAIVAQIRCSIDQEDSPEQIAQKVHQLEHQHYPQVLARLVRDL